LKQLKKLSRAASRLLSRGIAELTPENILKIQALFPQSPAPALEEAREDNTDIISVSPEEVLKAIMGAPKVYPRDQVVRDTST